MIKSLRRKFIAVTMISVVLVLALIIGIIDISSYLNIDQSAKQRMNMLIADQTGEKMMKPEGNPTDGGEHFGNNPISAETKFEMRYFIVVLNSKGNIVEVNTDSIASIGRNLARQKAKALYEKNKTSGYDGNYKYQTTSVTVDGNVDTMYLFLDCSRELGTFYSFLYASILVSLVGIALVFILVVISSKVIVKPVAESYEKQKRFITDASHEIKTPLAIIEANAEVIEMESGESEWLDSIKRQIKRLSSLTEKLVFLSKMDEESTKIEMTDVLFSELVEETAESFTAVALAQKKEFVCDIAQNLHLLGNEGMLRQMVSLLIDNAMKYSNEQGKIRIHLYENPKNHARILTIYNTVEIIRPGNQDILFERFYREDESRNSKTGGHGIGLSVVKAIVLAHHGKISAQSADGTSIIFTISLEHSSRNEAISG